MPDTINKTEADWQKELTPEQYNVLRQKGTEAPGTGKYYKNFTTGQYFCAACGNEIFASDSKFDSDCGWPSFDKAMPEAVAEHADTSLGMNRTEVTCNRCGSHLGHVFPDGPTPTGARYCINSAALNFKPADHA